MQYILATLKWSIVILILLVATVLLIPLGMMLLGYKVNADSGQIAELAVEKGNIAICDSIINYGIFGPPSDESRTHCVFRYAKLTKDPTACELLLPSDYGWSCLGAARKNGEVCSINYGKNVMWAETPYTDIRTATMDECRKGLTTTEKGEKCCYILQLTSEPGIDECSRFKGDEQFFNLCLSQLAMKRKDGSICAGITDDNARTICKIKIKYL